jgi:hypothetical protein
MATVFYRQCTLKRGNTQTVAWIEERGAKLDHCVTLKDSDDPKAFWEVIEVGTTRLSNLEVQAQARQSTDFKRMGSIANQ